MYLRLMSKIHVDIGASFFWHPEDKIRSPEWEVHLVEPIPEYHQQNVEKYKDNPTVFCHNVAIDETSGVKKFKIVDEEACKKLGMTPSYKFKGTAGFNPVDIKDQRDRVTMGLKNKAYKSIDVTCVTFDEFCESAGIVSIDNLKTDTEGHDVIILNTVDFNKYTITELKFEYVWAKQRDPQAYSKLIAKLEDLTFKMISRDKYDVTYVR